MVVPLLTKVRLPFTVPAAPGLNTTGTFTLCAGFKLIGVVMPALNPEPAIVSCVIASATLPVLVIFVVCVVGVFSTWLPKPRLLGVAERLAEDGTGVGLGEGVGPGVPEADFAPPPQPIALTRQVSKKRKRPA